MSLTKVQIVEPSHNQISFTQKRSSKIVETLFELIENTLESGENVLINNFSKFCVEQKD